MVTKIKSEKFIGQKDDVILPVRMRKYMYEELRIVSFEKKISMAEVARQAIEYFLEKKINK